MSRGRLALTIALTAAASAGIGALAVSRWLGQPERVVANYHKWYHRNGATTYNNTRWLGTATQKSPLDAWVFQEIIFEAKPDVLVETGTYKGGSSFYYASVMDLQNRGRILTVDIENYAGKPQHPRVQFFLGSSTSPEILDRLRAAIEPGEKVMVTLDSDHHAEHVADELRLYHDLVTPGSYLVVEDTHFNGRPILPGFGPGPYEAVEAFLRTHPNFQRDRTREKFGMTFNPGGWLKRLN
ncbi:MAG: class I SAM-dependent methyltransferase [Bryobacterales bacterium]|nr:class I SAM-dependent methyltransferase [Bryobacterales bacterium]